ncbi:MAG: response regulator [Candidatus Glassbacteria bacterium]|nr:response regulator [Candidatus Glassbacteria bacterium]
MKKILVVDDVPENRDIFAVGLEDEYQVLQAADGEEGLEVAEREKPDLIFLDVSMPAGMGGLDTIAALRKHHELYGIPVIAITAHSVVSAKRAVERGCNDFMLKPLTADKIRDKLIEWLPEDQ